MDSTPHRLQLEGLSPPALSAVIQMDRYSAVYCRQSGERLGESFQLKTMGGGGGLSVFIVIYILWKIKYRRYSRCPRLKRQLLRTQEISVQ